MSEPRTISSTAAIGAGIVVLVVAVLAGMRAGDRTMSHAVAGASARLSPAPLVITPATHQRSGAYGPSWRDSQVMAAPTDPAFPDPRVPPRPLPTAIPASKPVAKPSYNPNIPIWRQKPLPTMAPTGSPAPASPLPSPSSPPR